MSDRHIYIAGTGRAGTTFLVMYLTALGLDTTLARNPNSPVLEDANAGLEESVERLNGPDLPYIVKSPWLYLVLDELLERGDFHADAVIIPVRDLTDAAASRLALQASSISQAAPWMDSLKNRWDVWATVPGGLVYSLHPVDAERILAVGFHHLVERMAREEIPVIFLHFPRFALDGDYLRRALTPVFGAIDPARAAEAFARTADKSKIRFGFKT